MRRGYTQQDYRELVAKIREIIPGCSIATDIIVGFPGETHEQFMQTYQVLKDLRLDVAHLARYSSREGTVATRRMQDDVAADEKMERFRRLEELQEASSAKSINGTWHDGRGAVRREGARSLEGPNADQQTGLRRVR